MDAILQAVGLAKSYAGRRVVDGVNLDVGYGEIVGLLGPNGAGKTTTFRMLCGMLQPDRGQVILRGEDVTNWPMYVRARDGGMGYLPQQSSVFAKLTVEQNILAITQLLNYSRKDGKARCDALLKEFEIEHIRKSKGASLSGGERRRLEIARCLVSNPEIIMLDEPFAGIDPVTVQNIQVVIRKLRDEGISILITDHAAREILQITDRTFVVSEGRILCSGTAEEICNHEEVKRKYLGEIEMPSQTRSSAQFVLASKSSQAVPAPKGQMQREADSERSNSVRAPFDVHKMD
ncbi:MAG TPA: LPS export ABC transporter ATP-binding protein [Pirellulaceae bacterium]|nr:LPS export ABC transporter ATP-binding protein [Pirellulaceae bacterium]HMO93730.1 LPS export ABC transporter ATP-binding protein [Pirellulaceae bacterium]HMP69767.1 LPS export ABC transporter ATP-binding protein [Pirellulaceae bacterium]